MIIVDTHVLIWWLALPKKLSRRAARAINGSKRVGFSAITAWEIAMLAAKGRIRLECPTLEWLNEALAQPRVELVPLSPAIAAHAARFASGDPADRIIAATSIVEGVPLISADERIAGLPGVDVIWD